MARYNAGAYGSLTYGRAARRLKILHRAGMVQYRTRILKRGERLDKIAAIELGDSNLWWVIATISHIGFALQVPPGIEVNIPLDLDDVLIRIGLGGMY